MALRFFFLAASWREEMSSEALEARGHTTKPMMKLGMPTEPSGGHWGCGSLGYGSLGPWGSLGLEQP